MCVTRGGVGALMQTGIFDLCVIVSLTADDLLANMDKEVKQSLRFCFAKEHRHKCMESININPPFCLNFGRHIGVLASQVSGINGYD
jgi:hypothetical protein